MATVISRRVTAKIEGDFVVFLIGMRINRWWKPHRWMPVAFAMPRMLKELQGKPESGFMGVQPFGLGGMVQYWRSLDHLMRYARDRSGEHYPAWVAFNKAIGTSGDVGIWHETYVVRAGAYECIYSHMPPFGLAAASASADAVAGLETARGRLGQTDGTDRPSD